MERGRAHRRTLPVVLVLALLGSGCPAPLERPEASPGDPHHDWDGDGFCEEDPCASGAESGDCDDDNASVWPGAIEACDGIDNDCDGSLSAEETDDDGDGFNECADGDCDDGDAAIHPGQLETCNGIDDDCDSGTVEDEDGDGDGFSACDGDCDDTDPAAGPQAVETCDGADDDCDGEVDEGCVDCTRTVPGDHVTIQQALDAAAAGDVICVEPGVYDGGIEVPALDLHLLGVGGPGVTTVDGSGKARVLAIASGAPTTMIVEGFTLTHGQAIRGGGVSIDEGSPTLRHLVIADNEATDQGGGVWQNGGDTIFEHVVVRGNSCGTDGAGLAFISADTELRQVLIAENNAPQQGAGISIEGGTAGLLGVWLEGNHATGFGGSLFASDGAALDLIQTVMLGNTADKGGGMYLDENVTASMLHATVAGNETVYSGGGIYVYDHASLALASSTVAYNAGINGGGIRVKEFATTDIRYCNFGGNHPNEFDGITGSDLTECTLDEPSFLDSSSIDPLAWDIHLGSGSPLIDLGDPDVDDPDGSRSDMGAFSGSGASGWDLDRDGFPSWWQPGPYDASTYPGHGWDCDDRDPGKKPGFGC